MNEDDLLARLEQTAHDFEIHNPSKGVTYRGPCDVEAIRMAVTEIKRLREMLALAGPQGKEFW